MSNLDVVVDVYFVAQDLASEGREADADEAYAAVAEATASGVHDDEGDCTHPPAAIIRSMALNGRAELALDGALACGFPLRAAAPRAAATFLASALSASPDNASALMNLALLARDEGDAERALQLWSNAASPSAAEERRGADGWRERWLDEPRRRCAPLACLYRALLLSQLGRHSEATAELQRLGYRWRLAAEVWDRARMPPGETTRAPAGGADPPTAPPVRFFSRAVGVGVYAALRRAFSPEVRP